MVIHGQAGCGKTCVSVDLCRRYSARRQLLAGHFFYWRAARPDHNRAGTMLHGLARRMSQLLPGYDPFYCALLLAYHCGWFIYHGGRV